MNTNTATTIEQQKAQEQFRKKMLNKSVFRTFTLTQVPLGYLAGMKLNSLDLHTCSTSMKYKWINKNPFKSMYFAAQSMAAELSTAALCMLGIQGYAPSVAFIIIGMEATFPKKATGKVTFTCEDGDAIMECIQKAIDTGEASTIKTKTVGRMEDGTVVSEFFFTWSFKQRKSK
ncbi:DUF4442 domain-containing protein [Algivirga pacifica]|uniref:DUF4442 domain-containing protein n=1 Tax=Algivirga pacifica TaxID=1162670 RepID=A0ABP9DC40_9BACT